MTTSVHDLAKLRINRDPTPGVRRAFRWTLILAGVAAGLVAAVVLIVTGRRRTGPDAGRDAARRRRCGGRRRHGSHGERLRRGTHAGLGVRQGARSSRLPWSERRVVREER